MPDSALKATERQFMRLLQAAAGNIRVTFHCFSLPAVARSKQASEHIAHDYADIADLDRLGIDGLIVTGAEPIAANLPDEPFWQRAHRDHRLGQDQYALDHLVVPGGACGGQASRRRRAASAEREMLRRL